MDQADADPGAARERQRTADATAAAASAAAPPPPPIVRQNAPPPVVSPTAPAPEQADAESIAVTGSRVSGATMAQAVDAAGGDAQQSVAGRRIELTPWSPDRPYLAALDAAAAGDFERVLAEQQERHGAIPAFWLDVSDWAYRRGRRAEAVTLLLSALELPTRNSQTLAVVAERLMRWGETERAIFLLERLAASEPDRPQPLRNLALVLAKRAEAASAERRRADLARAIELMTKVVMTPWPAEYDGMEGIALMEVNRLIPLYKAAGGGAVPLDRRLVAPLDTDVRVVIEWNSEASDVDLWIDEPGGERAMYSNPRTRIGGWMSNDMTAGYGPEEYWVRRAPRGPFTVRAHVYSPDRINPNGASQVTATLIRDFGRPTQSEERIDIELLPAEEARERLIGRLAAR